MAKQVQKSGGGTGASALSPIVMQYLLAFLVPSIGRTIPVAQMRELKTLATAIDMTLVGRQDSASDVLMQRFRAIEMALRDGTWTVAKHVELVEDEHGSTSLPVREAATKEAVREGKLKKHIEKDPKGGGGRERSASKDRRRDNH